MPPLGADMIETDLATQEASRKQRYLPCLNLSSQRHLDEVDRPTTAIVARVPNDRHNLMELAWRIPIDCELREDTTKWAPPARVVERSKAGYQFCRLVTLGTRVAGTR
jgi:hypothetical protein